MENVYALSRLLPRPALRLIFTCSCHPTAQIVKTFYGKPLDLSKDNFGGPDIYVEWPDYFEIQYPIVVCCDLYNGPDIIMIKNEEMDIVHLARMVFAKSIDMRWVSARVRMMQDIFDFEDEDEMYEHVVSTYRLPCQGSALFKGNNRDWIDEHLVMCYATNFRVHTNEQDARVSKYDIVSKGFPSIVSMHSKNELQVHCKDAGIYYGNSWNKRKLLKAIYPNLFQGC